MDKAHTTEQFNTFVSQLAETNAPLGFWSDFGKITANVEKMAVRLCQLNYLIGRDDMEAAVRTLWEENPKAFSVLDTLIAVRTKDRKKTLNEAGEVQLISDFFKTPEGVIEFIKDTGLQEVFQNKQVTNLKDYAFGVETGLDSNSRKNRSGHIMENLIAGIFRKNGLPFRQEVDSTEYAEMACLGEDMKRFDFAIETPVTTYLIEVNFYNTSGSKLNEVARSYSELAPRINRVEGFEFVWITDGAGWKNARNKLEEAFYIIPNVYNLTTLHAFITKVKRELQ